MMNHSLALLGGDSRQISLAKRLAREGVFVRTFGIPCNEPCAQIVPFEDWREAIEGACAILLPLPASSDGRRVHLPLAGDGKAPLVREVLEAARALPVIGGRFSPAIKALAEEMGVTLYDFFESEELQVKNAVLTAEGAVSILMRELPVTVSGLSVAITGFGRVSKALVRLLLGMGAAVTVGARRESDVLAARALGCKAVRLTDAGAVLTLCSGSSVVFNTVPHWLFTESVLSKMNDKPLMIDLASAPGGFDPAAASARGIRVIWALSLPGKYAPESAGEVIAETVLTYLRREAIL